MFRVFALMAKAGDFCPKRSQTSTLQMPPADTTSFRKCLNDCQVFHSPQYFFFLMVILLLNPLLVSSLNSQSGRQAVQGSRALLWLRQNLLSGAKSGGRQE